MLQKWLQSQALRNQLLNDPYYRMQSTAEIAIAAALGIRINVNQASVDDWLRLPGLSIHQARSLVELRRTGVQFYCVDDIAAALNMPWQRLKPLEPVLHFCYYDQERDQRRLNPNMATVEMLLSIPAIDQTLAAAILQNRSSAGKFRNLVDLQQRLSLSGELVSQLMHYLCFWVTA